jgi:GT2 family glycosyltransferase
VPTLSVVIPTLERGALLHRTLEQVLAQSFRDLELIVVDQGGAESRAATEAFLAQRGDPRARYVHLPVRGLPNARNEGIARARGEFVLFLDDDVILLDPGFLDAHLDAYAAFPDVGAVTGRIVERSVRPNTRDTASHISPGGRTMTNLWGTERRFLESCKGANMSYRARVLRDVGGFDRRYVGTALLEDTDYGYRVRGAGWRILFEPRAELVHLSAPSGGVRVEDALRTEVARFRSTAYFVHKHRGVPGLAPFAATFGAIALARALRWRDPTVLRALAGAAAAGLRDAAAGPDEAIPAPADPC